MCDLFQLAIRILRGGPLPRSYFISRLVLDRHRSSLFLFALPMLLVAFRLSAAEPTNLVSFGFTGPEIFPIDSQISQLHVADLDGDGLNDLIVVNNSRSKINLLYNQTGKTNAKPVLKWTGRREANELPSDARFRIESIASEKRIASLIAAD